MKSEKGVEISEVYSIACYRMLSHVESNGHISRNSKFFELTNQIA